MASGESRKQSADDAAAIIVAVAENDAPALRYQTSSFTTKLVGIKVADLDGSKVSAFTSSWFD
jgi:hypothetical protein